MLLGVVDMYGDMLVAAPSLIIGLLYFFLYIIFMFLILINVFLAILNDAYAGIKGEMEERKEAKRQQEEEEAALGLEKGKQSRLEKARALAAAARGRYHRFQSRVSTLNVMRRRRKAAPSGVADF